MNLEGRRPLLLAIAGASVLSLGGLLWLSRSLWVAGTPADSSLGSLFDLLDDSKRASGTRTERLRPAPPPTLATWESPLRQACPLRDPALERRLQGLMVGLPRQRQRIRIDPTNYGQRLRRDVYGNPIDPTPRVVVLHETVYGLESAINTFRTPHPDDNDQVSYHTLIGGKGQVIDTLDSSRRAFGAGYSAFNGAWVFTSNKVGGSINNFALHISLETPIDGENDGPGHSGYSPAQYDALAVVLADWMRRYPIRPEAITTHRHVDLGQERSDPRSFNWSELQRRLAALRLIC